MMVEMRCDCAVKMGIRLQLKFIYLDTEVDSGGIVGDGDEDGGGGLVGIDLERGERIILPLRPQPCGRAQRRVILGGTPSFPRATTMTTSALGDALHIAMLSEVCGGWMSREDAGEMVWLMSDGGMIAVASYKRLVLIVVPM